MLALRGKETLEEFSVRLPRAACGYEASGPGWHAVYGDTQAASSMVPGDAYVNDDEEQRRAALGACRRRLAFAAIARRGNRSSGSPCHRPSGRDGWLALSKWTRDSLAASARVNAGVEHEGRSLIFMAAEDGKQRNTIRPHSFRTGEHYWRNAREGRSSDS